MKILALSGSNNPQSINTQLLAYAAKISGLEVTLLDMQPYDQLPLYSSARQQAGFPAEVEALYALLQDHDGFILASPEHNGSVPAVLKNLIDWLSRINMKFWGNKPLLLLSAAPGPNGGRTNLATLSTLVPWWGAHLTGSYSLGRFHEQFQQSELAAAEKAKLETVLADFRAALADSQALVA